MDRHKELKQLEGQYILAEPKCTNAIVPGGGPVKEAQQQVKQKSHQQKWAEKKKRCDVCGWGGSGRNWTRHCNQKQHRNAEECKEAGISCKASFNSKAIDEDKQRHLAWTTRAVDGRREIAR